MKNVLLLAVAARVGKISKRTKVSRVSFALPIGGVAVPIAPRVGRPRYPRRICTCGVLPAATFLPSSWRMTHG